MSKTVSIVDYGASNLHNVARAVEASGNEVEFVSDPDKLEHSDRVILPGVGAFGEGMRNLRNAGFTGSLRSYAESGGALLGICLGMQMLFSGSEEAKDEGGLGILEGDVRRIPKSDTSGERKIPHIGWATLAACESNSWLNSPLEAIDAKESVYFVHSYAIAAGSIDCEIAITEHLGFRFASFVRRGSIFGCQFHPEKSGPTGLKIIESFVAM